MYSVKEASVGRFVRFFVQWELLRAVVLVSEPRISNFGRVLGAVLRGRESGYWGLGG